MITNNDWILSTATQFRRNIRIENFSISINWSRTRSANSCALIVVSITMLMPFKFIDEVLKRYGVFISNLQTISHIKSEILHASYRLFCLKTASSVERAKKVKKLILYWSFILWTFFDEAEISEIAFTLWIFTQTVFKTCTDDIYCRKADDGGNYR